MSAADRALKAIPGSYEMLELKVYAKRQAGFDFYRGIHREKAERMWREAVDDVKQGIKPSKGLQPGERQTNASLLRSIVICLDMLGELHECKRWLQQWAAEHPDDPQVPRKLDFLVQKRGSFFSAIR
jgi:hypothetical protein